MRPTFDRRIKLEFHGSRITSDGGLLVYRELDDTLGFTDVAITKLLDGCRGKNTRHKPGGLFRQSVGRLAGYEDVNDAERLARDPAMRAIIGACDSSRALAYNLANFLRTLALPEEVDDWSPTTLREKLVKIGASIVRQAATSCSNSPKWAPAAPGMSTGSNDRWHPSRRGASLIDQNLPNAAEMLGKRRRSCTTSRLATALATLPPALE